MTLLVIRHGGSLAAGSSLNASTGSEQPVDMRHVAQHINAGRRTRIPFLRKGFGSTQKLAQRNTQLNPDLPFGQNFLNLAHTLRDLFIRVHLVTASRSL